VIGDAVDGSMLFVAAGSWAADGDIQYAYEWRRCGAAGGCTDIPDAIWALYPVSSDDVGSTLEVVVTATGAGGATTATSPPTTVVAAAPPANLDAVTISGTAQSGAPLTATTGDWGGTTPLAYTYQWQRCDAGGAVACVDIAGATAAGYAPVDAEVGAALRVVVTASNAAGSSASTSTTTATVLPQRPASAAAPAIAGTTREGSTLSADPGSWSSVAPDTYSYQWQRCDATGAQCADVAGATTSSYTALAADVGGTLRVVVGATNAGGTSSATSAATVRVAPQTASGFWNWQQWPYAVGLDKVWDAVSSAGATAPTIAVVDSGVDGSVPGLEGAVTDQVTMTSLPQADAADGYGHGTFVTGVAAGRGDGYAGAAPTAKIVSLDVLDDDGMARTSDVIAAADWIYQHEDEYGIRVANFSLIGSAPTSMTFDPLDSAIEKLWFSGVVVVAAAGNFAENGEESDEPYAPANDPFAITVGATDINGTLPPDDDFSAPWSAWGHTLDGFAKPELGAPGRYMVAPVPTASTLYQTRPDRIVDPGTLQLSGTSFAAPIVSGVAADLLALHPSWTPDQVKGALMLSAMVPGAAVPFSSGVGELDAAAALDVTDPPNPNADLDAFLVPDPAGGSTPVFDAGSWGTTVEGDGSWGTGSWGTGSWGTGSWGTGSWGTDYWSSEAYGASGSWGTGSWGTTTPDWGDNASADTLSAGGDWLNATP
jgi:serine protease AprX